MAVTDPHDRVGVGSLGDFRLRRRAPQRLPERARGRHHPTAPDVFSRGGTLVVAPDGEVVAGPMYDQEGMLIVDCEVRQTIRAKYAFDSVGHYSREDALLDQLRAASPGASPRVGVSEPDN